MDGVNMTVKELRLPGSNVNPNPRQPQPHPLQLHHVLKHPYILHTGTILMYDYLEAEMKTKVNLIYLPLRLKEASARSTISLRSHIICTNTTTSTSFSSC